MLVWTSEKSQTLVTDFPVPAKVAFWSVAFERRTVIRALQVSAFVGTLLTIINQGDLLIKGAWESVNLLKVLLTYCVPYCVSTYSSAAYAVSAAAEQKALIDQARACMAQSGPTLHTMATRERSHG